MRNSYSLQADQRVQWNISSPPPDIEQPVQVVAIASSARGLSTRALANECFSINWDTVPYYSQQTDSSCWAAAAAMVVAWRDGTTLSDADIAAKVPLVSSYWNGLLPRDRRVLADLWGLVPEPPASYTVDAWRYMLQSYGPLFLDMTNSAYGGGHAWVLVGMTSDGAEDCSDTMMYLHNPWPSKGKLKWKFQDFLKLYEGRVGTEGDTLECQILHAAAVPAGMRPVTAAPFALAQAVERQRPLISGRKIGARAMASNDSDYAVPLIPQPDKNSCWAASMAMLLSFRRNTSYSPETLANEVGGSLKTSYDWALLKVARDRYGFTVIEQPSNTSLYFSPTQWADWLQHYGPLWVVIVGMPHAVVLAGIRGDLDNPDFVEVKVLNPWDTAVDFDDDPVVFHPANNGYQGWMPFNQFASDFGNMAVSDYGNWRVLHLSAQAVAQGLSHDTGSPWATPPRRVRATAVESGTPIQPSRIAGTSMFRCEGQSGRISWQLDQLEGMKMPNPAPAVVGVAVDTQLALDTWPRFGEDPVPLPLTITFAGDGAAVGNVRILPGQAAPVAYDVSVIATIDDDPGTAPAMASLKVHIEYRYRGTPEGDRTAVIDLRLPGNGRHDQDNHWL